MAKVLLVNFPPQGLEIPPIGLASIFANIRDITEAEVFDFNIALYHEGYFPKTRWDFSDYKFWESEVTADNLLQSKSYLHLLDLLKSKDYDVVCFSINIHGYRLLSLLLDHIFAQVNQKLIIVGGPFCSEPEIKNLRRSVYVDLFVVGEGELILRDIIRRYRSKKSIKTLKNIHLTYAGNRFVIANKITDLSVLKNPDYSSFNLELYTCNNSIPMYFSRGCNYDCCFCRDKPIWGCNVWRKPEEITEEMVSLNKKYSVKDFYLVDLDVLSNPDKLEHLCRLILKEKLNVSWSGQARVSPFISIDFLKLIQQAGCRSLCIGMESGASRVCKDMGKENPAVVSKFIRMAYDAKISISLAIIVGYPTETWWDFSKTAFFLLKNSKYITRIPSINILHIPSESVMFSNLDKYNISIVDGDWKIKGKHTAVTRKVRYKILDFIVNFLFKSKRYV